jgi:putative transposase
MASEKNNNTVNEATSSWFCDPEALKELITILVEKTIQGQFDQALGAEHYERSEHRKGYRNGAKPRTMNTRVGKLEFQVPQIRNSEEPFRPTIFDRYQRSEKALLLTVSEMYIKGVSTREVAAVMEEMGGFKISAQTVSRATAQLDEAIKEWRERPLSEVKYPYLIVDARYEKVRKKGRVVSQAVMIACGVNEYGNREILGVYTGDSESEDTWSDVFKDLKKRGLGGVELLVSDAHQGIIKAAGKHLQGVCWQRCKVHFMREILNKVSWRDRPELASDLKTIYACTDKEQCLLTAMEVADKWESKSSKVAKTIRNGAEDTLTVNAMELPSNHRRKLHSTNMIERQNRELKRRTRKVSIFPNEDSVIRLFGAMLIDIDEKWQSETKVYLNMELRE